MTTIQTVAALTLSCACATAAAAQTAPPAPAAQPVRQVSPQPLPPLLAPMPGAPAAAPAAPAVPATPAPQAPPAPGAVPLGPDVVWPEVPDLPALPDFDLSLVPDIDVAAIHAAMESARAAADAFMFQPPTPGSAPVWPVAVWPEVPDLPTLPDLDLPLVREIDLAAIHAATESARAAADAFMFQSPSPGSATPAPRPSPPVYVDAGGSLYDQARAYIDRDQYERALTALDRLIEQGGARTDAAMYWKAYSLLKMARAGDALTALADLQKRFPKSAWVDDARRLELEARRAAGQPVSAEVQGDEEMRLLALQGLMQSDPETALPYIEKMLAGPGSVRLKDRALYVVSRSKSPRGREIIIGVAKGAANPDLKRSAIRYLGRMAGTDTTQVLDALYRESSDLEMKRTILRSYMESRARDRLLAIAKSEAAPELRRDAVQYLGALRATAELEELYRSETDQDVKRRIIQGLGQAADKLGPIVRAEKDPQLRAAAIRQLGTVNTPEATAMLTGIYSAEGVEEIRKAAIDALAMSSRNAAALVGLARAEKNAEMKTYIVRRLSTMRAPEAREYMLELLK